MRVKERKVRGNKGTEKKRKEKNMNSLNKMLKNALDLSFFLLISISVESDFFLFL